MVNIAYGCSKLLHFYLNNASNPISFSQIVDERYKENSFCEIEVVRIDQIKSENLENFYIYIFAVSNNTINEIILSLSEIGMNLGGRVFLYSDLFAADFQDHALNALNWTTDTALARYSTAFTLNSRKPVHTTICGSWLFLEALRRAELLDGDVVEVGAYEGGNVLGALQSPVWSGKKTYYVLDSFEGFPDLTALDPARFERGDYRHEHSLGEVLAPFSVYPEAQVIRGFVPGTFDQLTQDGRYSLVFYDCDLYQPALDTFSYFWNRMVPGGIMLVHDYFAEPGGYAGVKEATDLFFAGHQGIQAKFWHNTMAVFVKP
jgi:hypothetical protein